MTRDEFMGRLRRGLVGLPTAAAADIASDYEAHFEDGAAAGRSEAEVAAALGDPDRLARELRAESTARRWTQEQNPSAAVGAVFGLLLGWSTTVLRLDQFVIGLALFFAATGLAGLLFRVVIGQTGQTPLIDTLPRLEIPLLSDIPLLGTALFSHNVLVYLAALLAVGLYFLLYRTRAGLDLRSVGENPKAADSLGIPVRWTRLWTSTAGGALMGIAGAYLPMVYTGTFTEGIVAGRGWLAIALTFFGGWRPQYIVAGALFFATMDVVALRAEVSDVGIPSQALLVVPYVATLLVMTFAFRWARVPAFLGRNYDRESRTG